MRNKIFKDHLSIKFLAYLSFLISVLMHTVTFLSYYFGDGIAFQQIGDPKRPPFHIDGFLLNIISTFILALVLYIYNLHIYKNIKKHNLMIFVMISGALGITVIMSLIYTTINPYILGHVDQQIPFDQKIHVYRNGLMNDFFAAMVVILSWQLIMSNHRNYKIVLENESLVTENMVARYEVLKNQVNPHFLFNSLNTLQSLIELDKEKSKDFVQELSKVLRYSMQNQEVVTLKEELQTANSYCSLMEMRYGDNLRIDFEIDDRMLDYEIIPLSLQVLIENAIKHNVISDKQPLHITIVSDYENCQLIVSNKIHLKMNKDKSNGIGLANLSERYRLKWNNDIEIIDDNVCFCVKIKLNKNNCFF